LQTILTKAYSSKEAVFNSDANILYDIAGKNIYAYNFPTMTARTPSNITYSVDSSFGCFYNNRIYVSNSNVDNYDKDLGDHNQIFSGTPPYSNTEGIRWNPYLQKMFVIVGSKLYSYKLDGSDQQLVYTDPSDITALDIDSDGYIHMTAFTRIITLNPNLTLNTNITNVAISSYIYAKKVSSSIKLLFVTTAESGTGISSITVIKIKNDSTKTIIKKMIMPDDSYALDGINGHEGKVIVTDENKKKIYLMLF